MWPTLLNQHQKNVKSAYLEDSPDIMYMSRLWAIHGPDAIWLYRYSIRCYEFIVISQWGKTMNSYLQNHDFMVMLPSPQEAEKRGLAPPDVFPHK